MKKRSFLLLALLCLPVIAFASSKSGEHRRELPSYSSLITKEECRLCSIEASPELRFSFGQDNLGLVDLNTFEAALIEVNPYNGDWPINEATGFLQISMAEVGGTQISVRTNVDRGWAALSFVRPRERIRPKAIGAFLCEDCLAGFRDDCVTGDPMSIAVIDFASRTIHPLCENARWFSIGNFLVDCSFEGEEIWLRFTYRPVRYRQEEQDNPASMFAKRLKPQD